MRFFHFIELAFKIFCLSIIVFTLCGIFNIIDVKIDILPIVLYLAMIASSSISFISVYMND